MSEGGEKTEEATPQRKKDAREKGQIPNSAELAQGALLLAGIGSLWVGVGVARGLKDSMRRGLGEIRVDLTESDLPALAMAKLWEFGLTVGPLLAIIATTGIAVGVLQSGFNISTTALSPDLGRLSVIRGFGRIFSSRSIVKLGVSLAKVAIVIAIAVFVVYGRLGSITETGRGSLLSAVQTGWGTGVAIALSVAAAMTVVGVLDFLYQKWKHDQELMMSLQEVREDNKQQEGDPLIRARLRRLQRERATGRMMQDVPDATVIVTNPTHISVALKYDRATMAAPIVVAKGADAIAFRIRQIAEENDVPIVERKPIARALYAHAEVGEEIPVELFQAVAEVLSYLISIQRAA